jgi:hypothetical protein
LRNFAEKESQQLCVGDSLAPLYRSVADKTNSRRLFGYEVCTDPVSCNDKFTHRIVGHWKYLEDYPRKEYVVHHKDFQKLNNDPSNLILMHVKDHAYLHFVLNRRLWETPELKLKISQLSSERMTKKWEDPEFVVAHAEWSRRSFNERWATKEWQDLMSEVGRQVMTDNWSKEDWRNKMTEICRKNLENNWNNPDYVEKMSKYMTERLKEWWTDPEYRDHMKEVSKRHGQHMKNLMDDPEWYSKWYSAMIAGYRRKMDDPEFVKDQSERNTAIMNSNWEKPEFRELVSRSVSKASKERRKKELDEKLKAVGLTFDLIKETILEKGIRSIKGLGKALNCSYYLVKAVLRDEGVPFEEQSQWVRNYKNHKVVSVEPGPISELFSVKSTTGNFVSNGVFLCS